jgi:hypothetical protein
VKEIPLRRGCQRDSGSVGVRPGRRQHTATVDGVGCRVGHTQRSLVVTHTVRYRDRSTAQLAANPAHGCAGLERDVADPAHGPAVARRRFARLPRAETDVVGVAGTQRGITAQMHRLKLHGGGRGAGTMEKSSETGDNWRRRIIGQGAGTPSPPAGGKGVRLSGLRVCPAQAPRSQAGTRRRPSACLRLAWVDVKAWRVV